MVKCRSCARKETHAPDREVVAACRAGVVVIHVLIYEFLPADQFEAFLDLCDMLRHEVHLPCSRQIPFSRLVRLVVVAEARGIGLVQASVLVCADQGLGVFASVEILCRLVPILDPGDVREQAYVLVVGADIGVSPEPGVSLGCEQEFSLVGDDATPSGENASLSASFSQRAALK